MPFVFLFSGIISKSKGHVHRVAMCLQALKDSQKVLVETEGNTQDCITAEFKNSIKEYLKNHNDWKFEVDLDTSKKAIKLTDYFTEHKQLLAGYDLTTGVPIHNDTEHINNATIKHMRDIILANGQEVLTSVVNKKSHGGIGATTIKDIMIRLTAKGLGKSLDYKPDKGGKTSHRFIKQDIDTLNEIKREDFVKQLSELNITVEQYKEAFSKVPSKSQDAQKRCSDEQNDGHHKKFR